MNDGSQVEAINYFDENFRWEKATRTFHGSISWTPVTFKGTYRWDVAPAFTNDFADVLSGVIHERKERLLGKKDKINPEDMIRFQYPLDGVWKILWLSEEGKEEKGSITVCNNEFKQGPYLFNLNFSDPRVPSFRWPLDPVDAVAKSGVNLEEEPLGPDVGETIVWATTHPSFEEITWTRESIGDDPGEVSYHFGLGSDEYTSFGPGDAEYADTGTISDYSEGSLPSDSSSSESSEGWSDDSGNSSSQYRDEEEEGFFSDSESESASS